MASLDQSTGPEEIGDDHTGCRGVGFLEVFLPDRTGALVSVGRRDEIGGFHDVFVGTVGGLKNFTHAIQNIVGLSANIPGTDDLSVLATGGGA